MLFLFLQAECILSGMNTIHSNYNKIVVDFERFFIVVMVCINVCMREDNFVCSGCGVSGYKRPSVLKKFRNHFCSRDCSSKHKNTNVEVKCSSCNVLIKKKQSTLNKSKNHFCSTTCFGKFKENKIKLNCLQCNNIFLRELSAIRLNNFCSCDCAYKYRNKAITINCSQCNKIFLKAPSQIKNKKNNFCSVECQHKFANKKVQVKCLVCDVLFMKYLCNSIKNPRHCCSKECYYILIREKKDWGSTRSKLEIAIENKLNLLYGFEIRYNKTDIGYELDIYIPVLDLAIEINGIFHYEAIFGEKELLRRQEIDKEKVVECRELGIKLFVIDVSKDKNNKKVMAQRILEVEGIVRDRIRELGYVGQMVLEI